MYILLLMVYSIAPQATGQENEIYSEMSLDELLNIDVVVTASKKPEDLFDAPLSVTIINKEEINNSGVTSIPEALRLSPGLIVREIAPGNYDVHIRGYDDITKSPYINLPYNTTTLVMIDNRIVHNYFSGGTLWETFPIDLNDIEQIEIVRGPAAALYGPNAVTGVINIITIRASKQGMSVSAHGSAGNNLAKTASTNIGYNWNDKTKLTFTGNFSQRHRFKEEYFNYITNSYTQLEDLTMTLAPIKDKNTGDIWTYKEFQKKLGAYYDKDLSLSRMGGNIFFYHRFSGNSDIDIAMGAQKSQSLNAGFLNLATALSQINSESFYLNSRMNWKNFNAQIDITSGQDLSNYKFNSYKFKNIDANLEYYRQFSEFSVRYGISYKRSSYNSPVTYEEPFSFNSLNYQFKDEPRNNSSFSTSLLTEWKPNSKLRFIGAIRMDKFNINKNYSINHEIASTYRINKNNLVRFTYSRSNRSPFIFETYLNCNISVNNIHLSENNKIPIVVPVGIDIYGKKDLKYPTITNQEICWRTKLSSNMSLEVEIFNSWVTNFVSPNTYRHEAILQKFNQFGEADSIISVKAGAESVFENQNFSAQQFGAGLNFSIKLSDKFNAEIHGNYQKTKISGKNDENFTATKVHIGNITPDNTILTEIDSEMNASHWSDKLTPAFVGGFILNYKYNDRWNFSTDAYIYTNQEFSNYDYYSIINKDEGKKILQMDIKSNMILNAKSSYRINKNLTSYISLRNILGSHREFGYADQIGTLYLIGINWEM